MIATWLGELAEGRSWPATLRRWTVANCATGPARDFAVGCATNWRRATTWASAIRRAAPRSSEPLRVIDGEVVAAELEGGRRLSRRAQRLALEGGSTTLTSHG